MKSITSHTGIVTDIQRLKSSAFGNPRYQFNVDGYTVKTAVDSSYGYEITNYENKMVDVTIGSHYGTLTLNSIKLTK